MKYAKRSAFADDVSEMVVVDTFTKLIFEHEADFSPLELAIIQTFRLVDDNVVLDSHQDMGVYLRALGVTEMVELVNRVCLRLGDEHAVARALSGETGARAERRVH